MGDKARHDVFAAWIKRVFGLRRFKRRKRRPTIVCVADGKGALANRLSALGFAVTVFERRQRHPGLRPYVRHVRAEFTRDTPLKATDLVVGMHPDEAAPEIVLAARRARRPFAVVPCCLLGPEAIDVKTERGWLNKIKSLARDAMEARLPICGRNVVIWGRA